MLPESPRWQAQGKGERTKVSAEVARSCLPARLMISNKPRKTTFSSLSSLCRFLCTFPPYSTLHLSIMLFTKVLSSLAALSCAVANTVFTGDVRSGVPVISYLSLEDVPTEAITRYYLQVPGYNGGGLEGSLPIWVARGPPGTLNGKKLTVSGVFNVTSLTL